jgi:hypothetical protein
MGVRRQGAQEDDFAQLQARRQGLERLLHGLDGDKSASAGNSGTGRSSSSQHNATEASVSDFLDDLEAVLESHGAVRLSPQGHFRGGCHGGGWLCDGFTASDDVLQRRYQEVAEQLPQSPRMRGEEEDGQPKKDVTEQKGNT